MKLIRMGAVIVLIGGIVGIQPSFALTDPIAVNTSLNQNRRWEAVFTNEVPLEWEWFADATTAQLKIVGMNSTLTETFTTDTSNYLWQAFSGDTPSCEDVYDLTLTFYNVGNEVAGAQTSRLAVVKAALGKTDIVATSESTPWPRLENNAVIPYDSGWLETTATAEASQLVITKEENGMTQTNALSDVAGYFGWKVVHSDWGYGTFNLALTFPDTEGEWNGTLERLPSCTLIFVR